MIVILFAVSACYGALDQPVPFRLEKGYLIVTKCSIADLPELTAIVDTGVTETVLDSTIVQRLQLPTNPDKATFIAKDIPVRLTTLPSLTFGPIRVNSLAAIATELSGLTRQFGFRPDVLIGMDVLHRSSFTIDYKARLLKFEPVTSLSHAAALLEAGRLALIEVILSGQPTRLQLDTGVPGVVVYRDRLRDPIPAGGPVTTATLLGVAVSFDASNTGDRHLRVGNWSAYQLPITVIDRGSEHFFEFDGLLGARILTSRRLCLDFSHMMVYWD